MSESAEEKLMSTMIDSPASGGASTQLWTGVDRLIDRAPSLADLRAHRLHLLAARLWRGRRWSVPDELASEEMHAVTCLAAARNTLCRARAAYDGQMLILKGLHTATLYPAPHLRPFSDVDLLVDDPERAQRALLAAGFVPTGCADEYYEGLHHLRPLVGPGAILVMVEIHRWPNWLPWGEPPTARELLAASVPDVVQVEGVLGLAPAHQVLVSAVHSWVELPLRRLGDLVDVAAGMTIADAGEAHALAQSWDIVRLWNTTLSAIQSLFFDGPRPYPLRTWARNLESVRDRTVLETHIRRACSPFWARPPIPALGQFARAVADAARPAPSDTWETKLRRTKIAIGNLPRPSEEHCKDLGSDGRRAPRFRRR